MCALTHSNAGGTHVVAQAGTFVIKQSLNSPRHFILSPRDAAPDKHLTPAAMHS